MRNIGTPRTTCAKPHAAVKIEYISTLAIIARVRPNRSAIQPKTNAASGRRDEHGRSEQAALRLRQPEIGA